MILEAYYKWNRSPSLCVGTGACMEGTLNSNSFLLQLPCYSWESQIFHLLSGVFAFPPTLDLLPRLLTW